MSVDREARRGRQVRQAWRALEVFRETPDPKEIREREVSLARQVLKGLKVLLELRG